MAQRPRRISEGDVYHVVARGVSHSIIFEDDSDRTHFLDELAKIFGEQSANIYAWCLMDNHYHILVKLKLNRLSEAMKRLNSSYALYFNTRYERDGHLFQGRFKSEAIDSDEYFLTTLRYIHQNPIKAGLAHTCDYRWSSYRAYAGDNAMYPSLTETDFALKLLGGRAAFARFHATADTTATCCDIGRSRKLINDNHAKEVAEAVLGNLSLWSIASLPRKERNAALRKLRNANLSIRQIERLTGISRGIIAKS